LDCIRERDPKPSEGWQFLVDNRPRQYYLERTSRKLETAKTVALSIKTDEADRLARALARLTGETMTEAVTAALRERLARERAGPRGRRRAAGAPRRAVTAPARRLRHAAGEQSRMG